MLLIWKLWLPMSASSGEHRRRLQRYPRLADRPQLRPAQQGQLGQPPRQNQSLKGDRSFDGFRFSCHTHTVRQPQRKQLRQPDRRKRQLEVWQARQLPPRGRPFTILNTAVDVTERTEVAALGQR